jgi:methylase of polypeptide subunit release factors
MKHHHIFNMVLEGSLYRAPIPDNVSHVLDIGTGTGLWAIDMAEYGPLSKNGAVQAINRFFQ